MDDPRQQHGNHTWDIVTSYERCPNCAYINEDRNKYILIPVESCNLGNAKVLAIQRSKMGPYTDMNQFFIVESRGFGTAEIAAFNWNEYIRPLSKFHLFAKMILFGILIAKFFNHMYTYAFKIWQSICSKTIHFFKQSKFRKRSIYQSGFYQKDLICDRYQGAFTVTSALSHLPSLLQD